jgi:hypothetical protein
MKQSISLLIILSLTLLPVKSKDIKHWKVSPNGWTIPSSEVIREFGFGRHHLIDFSDSIHFTIYPRSQHKPIYDTWNGKE